MASMHFQVSTSNLCVGVRGQGVSEPVNEIHHTEHINRRDSARDATDDG